MDRNCSRSTPRLCTTVGLFALAISAWVARAAEDTRPDDQPSDLANLRDKYFGWFISIRATRKGLVFRAGSTSQWIMVSRHGHEPLEEMMPDGSKRFIDALHPDDEVTLKIGSDISFGSMGEEGLRFLPLPDELQPWGFRVTFTTWSYSGTVKVGDRVYPGLEKKGHSDYAIALLLRRRDQAADDPAREILLIPDDVEAARRIVAGGGFMPESAGGDANAAVHADPSTAPRQEPRHPEPKAREAAHEREWGEAGRRVPGTVVSGVLALVAAGVAIWIWLAGRRNAAGRDL